MAGKAISSITINGKSDYNVTIYGEQQALESIDCVPVTIDLTDQGNNGSKTYNVTISKPTGVRYMPTTSASIVVNFGEAKQKTINNVQINVRNTPSGLTANAIGSASVNVQVIGVESVINSIDASNISAYIDLTGYAAGTHKVPVYITGNSINTAIAKFIVESEVEISLTQSK